MENNGWRLFFNSFAPYYMQESFTRNTRYEVDFIEEEFNLPKHSYIIDIGCGTGRHSIELAKRGYNVTGVDIVEHIWGGTAGSWKRKPLKMDEIEVMVLSRKIKDVD